MATIHWLPTQTTLEGLDRARKQFAEQGYYIFSPHWTYARSSRDFIAVDKEFGHLFLVRAGKKGIEVRRRHEPLRDPLIIKSVREKAGISVRQRHFMPRYYFDEWTVWIDETEHSEFHELLRQSGRVRRRRQ